jgi:hypothetical protein
MITLLNTSILTAYGTFDYQPLELAKAREMVAYDQCSCYGHFPCQACGGGGLLLHMPKYESAIGHESTAEIMTELLGVDVRVNRQMAAQEVGTEAIVFKLKARAPEGRILSREEIEAIGYEFGLRA